MGNKARTVWEVPCVAHGCEAISTEPIDIGFNEMGTRGLKTHRERIWVCPEHMEAVTSEILRSIQ